MNMLSKLQDETRRKCNSNKGCSNFEDCESITKMLMGFFNVLNIMPLKPLHISSITYFSSDQKPHQLPH